MAGRKTHHGNTGRQGRSALLALVALIPALLITSAPAAAFTSAPLWQCRGSALYASVSGNNRVEPVVANGNPNTANGVSPDREQCVNSEAGAGNLPSPVGLPANFLNAQTARAMTGITPAIGPSITQSFLAVGGVENLALQLPPGSGTVALGIGAANASVSGSCVGGQPVLKGASQAANITLGGQPVSLDALLSALGNALKPLNALVFLKVNEQIPGPNSLTVNALHIGLVNSTNNASLLDLVVGQAKGGYDSLVCDPNHQFIIPPTINIPPGAINGTGGGNGFNDCDFDNDNGFDNDNDAAKDKCPPGGAAGSGANGNIGSANGPAATCGRLTMYFDRNRKLAIANVFGNRLVTRGRLVTCDRRHRSIVGAKIDVVHIIRGQRHLIKTGLKSRPGGKLTLILPMNLTTRLIEYSYRPNLLSKKVSSRKTLRLTVHDRRGKLVR